MIRSLVTYALRHRIIALALLAAFVVAGIGAFRRLPVEAYPDVTNIQVQIITLFPGHAAEEVERLVTVPVENEMNGIPKRASLRSISIFGLSVVTIVFEDTADGAYVRSQAFERLQSVALPSGAQANLSPDSTPVGEIYRYTVVGPPGFSSLELKSLEDWVVERKLRTVPGVVDVVGFGGPTKQYQVHVDPARLKSYGVTLAQVFDALAKGNRNAGGAYIEHGPEMEVVRGLGLVRGLDDIGGIAVASRNGTPIWIRDLATVALGPRLRLGRVGKRSGADQDDVVQGIVLLRKGENALDVLTRVREKVAEINRSGLPRGVRIVPHYDRTDLIGRTLHTVRKNMAEGIGLVLVVLVAFLGIHNARSALVVAAVVPLSLLGAFLLLDLRGIPANLISMGAIDFGIIVDAAVVVVENFLRLRAERGLPAHAAIVEAAVQVGKPILFSKAILITAFLPLYTLQRVEGKIFRPMALTLTFALVWGTVFALTIVPVLTSFAARKREGGTGWKPEVAGARRKLEAESRLVSGLRRRYLPALAAVLARRRLTLLLAGAGIVIGAAVALFLGSEFLPKLDEGALWVRASMPGAISPTEAARETRKIRQILGSFPEVRTVVSQLGRPDDGTDVNGFDTAEFYADLAPRDMWKTASTREALSDAMNRRLASLPGIDFNFSQVIEDNVNEAVSGIKGELGIKIYGDDPEVLQQLADRVAAVLEKVSGAADVSAERLAGQPQIQITVDRAAIGRYGMSISDVQTVIETAIGGAVATQVLEGEKTFDLVVRMDPGAVSDVDSIRALPVPGGSGEKLTLGSVAAVRIAPGAARVYREENSRRIAVRLSVRGRDLGSVVSEARARVQAAVPLPPGYHLEWTGSFENQQRALGRLRIILPVTLGIIFFLLFAAFDSAGLALLILLNVPFAAVGGVLALFAAGLAVSISALVGFVALFGVSVQNGVLLIERIRQLRRRGMSVEESIRGGASSRMRPVLMTACMAAFGLLPAALSRGVGAETQRPFAVVIIGGLVTATLLTLFVLPVLYDLFERGGEPGSPTSGSGGDAGPGQTIASST
jgi:cobalt-zinc-cadmium resistance protein CzcA